MTKKERITAALRAGKPDRVPVFPIYDYGYMMTSAGLTPRDYYTADAGSRVAFQEAALLRHDADGFHCHEGVSSTWGEDHEVDRSRDDIWFVTDRITGKKYGILPHGEITDEQGIPVSPDSGSLDAFSEKTVRDVVAFLEAKFHPSNNFQERFEPLRRLSKKYCDHYYAFHSRSPGIDVIEACGGYVPGLMAMTAQPDFFREAQREALPYLEQLLRVGKAAGGDAAWIISMYFGAESISPDMYADLIMPFEYKLMSYAKSLGLDVLYWFCGNVNPLLDHIRSLPIDALVLEQGRKGYDCDPAAVREKVGDRLCLFGFGQEMDYCDFNRNSLTAAVERQIAGAGKNGAFVAGTPYMPSNARPEAVDFYIDQVKRFGAYNLQGTAS